MTMYRAPVAAVPPTTLEICRFYITLHYITQYVLVQRSPDDRGVQR